MNTGQHLTTKFSKYFGNFHVKVILMGYLLKGNACTFYLLSNILIHIVHAQRLNLYEWFSFNANMHPTEKEACTP